MPARNCGGTVTSKLCVICLVSILGLRGISLADQPIATLRWPAIVSFHKQFHFSDAQHARADITLSSANGKALYLLRCQGREASVDHEFDFSGDFECRLKSLYSAEVYSTLLTDDPEQHHDWDRRGRFLAEEIVGPCGTVPDYGRVRIFRLRHMRIRLEMSNIILQQGSKPGTAERPRLRSFDFSLDARLDSAAQSAIAAVVSTQRRHYINSADPHDFRLDCGR